MKIVIYNDIIESAVIEKVKVFFKYIAIIEFSENICHKRILFNLSR